jgi:hypothetical protein
LAKSRSPSASLSAARSSPAAPPARRWARTALQTRRPITFATAGQRAPVRRGDVSSPKGNISYPSVVTRAQSR